LTLATTTAPQLAFSAGAGVAQWTMRNAGGNLYFATTTVAGTATTTTTAFTIIGSTGKIGISTTTPWAQLSVNSNALGSGVPEFVIGSSTKTHFVVNGGGNVGIGTANPTAKLTVTGTQAFVANTPTAGILYSGTLVEPTAAYYAAGVSIAPTFGSGSSNMQDTIGLYLGGHAKGTSGTITGDYGLYVDNNSMAATNKYGLYVIAPTGGTSVNAAAYFGGNVGIGTVAPSALLQVDGGDYSSPGLIDDDGFGGITGSGTSFLTDLQVGDLFRTCPDGCGTWYTITSITDDTNMTVNGSDGGISGFPYQATRGTRFIVNSNGIVGIGTTTPWGRFSVEANNTSDSPLFVVGSSTATSLVVGQSGYVGIGTASPLYNLHVKGTVCLDLNADDVCTDNTSALSDSRLKDNVQNIMGALDIIDKLRGVTFTWNGLNHTGHANSLGFLAQDVEAILPNMDLVITDTAGYKHLDYSKLTAVLATGVQELDVKVTSIDERVKTLETLAFTIGTTTQAISTTTATTTPQGLVDGFWQNIFARVTTWLADAANGLSSIVANVLNAKEKICVDGECLTKDDVKNLLTLVHSQNGASNASTPTPAGIGEIPDDSSENPALTSEPVADSVSVTTDTSPTETPASDVPVESSQELTTTPTPTPAPESVPAETVTDNNSGSPVSTETPVTTADNNASATVEVTP
jgi:hypothetical protein